ncbi:hypothetical protein Pelo_6202 [Pelomyxa schiedti]|nr:hypothetical protein Pelo_6202 [Pelomyxa schiedti]
MSNQEVSVEAALEGVLASIRAHGPNSCPLARILPLLRLPAASPDVDASPSSSLLLSPRPTPPPSSSSSASASASASAATPPPTPTVPLALKQSMRCVVTPATGQDEPMVSPMCGRRFIDEEVLPSGARVTAAWPHGWGSWPARVLLKCHGFRTPSARGPSPELCVDEDPLVCELMARGWAVAATSYRRDGLCVTDGIEDARDLREWVVSKCVERNCALPAVVLLEGRSMGGCVCTLVAERYPGLFDGVVAVGAALLAGMGERPPIPFAHNPRIPILYLTNQSECGPIEAYIDGTRAVSSASSSATETIGDRPVIVPALWQVLRDGHNSASVGERLSALDAVLSWIKYGTAITMRKRDLIISPQPRANSPIIDSAHRSAIATVQSIHSNLRYVVLNMMPEDMAATGIRQGKNFTLTHIHKPTPATKGTTSTPGPRSFTVKYCTYPPLGVEKGDLFALDDPDGGIVISIFGWFLDTDTAADMGLQVGMKVELHA